MGLWIGLLGAASVLASPPLEELVKAGRLTEATAALERTPWPNQPQGASRRSACQLLVMRNRLDAAADCLSSDLKGAPDDVEANGLLAEVRLRQARWTEAAAAERAAGRSVAAARAEALSQASPYQGKLSRTTVVPFVRTDPLPVLRARIGDGPELYFILDTGAADTVIDKTVAASLNLNLLGSSVGAFAGGKTATIQAAILPELRLGDMSLRQVPVVVLDTSRFRGAAGGLPVSGVIGLGLMSQFLATIDYPHGRLVLSPTGTRLRNSSHAATLPMWLAGDHFVLVDGALNNSRQLSFIDTGMAGAGCTAPFSSIDAAGLSVAGPEQSGEGGGGTVSARAFTAPTISLGPVSVKNVPCLAGVFPPSLETSLGTRIGQLVSHGALSGYAVTFDFHRMELTLDPGPQI